jgi:hypothetical protein
MATRADLLEISFAGFRVAHNDAGRSHAGDIIAADFEVMDISGNIGNLRLGQVDLGHFTAAIHDNGSDEFALEVIEDEFRTEEIGAAFPAPRVRAVAKIAVDTIDCFASLERGGIGLRMGGERGWTLRMYSCD